MKRERITALLLAFIMLAQLMCGALAAAPAEHISEEPETSLLTEASDGGPYLSSATSNAPTRLYIAGNPAALPENGAVTYQGGDEDTAKWWVTNSAGAYTLHLSGASLTAMEPAVGDDYCDSALIMADGALTVKAEAGTVNVLRADDYEKAIYSSGPITLSGAGDLSIVTCYSACLASDSLINAASEGLLALYGNGSSVMDDYSCDIYVGGLPYDAYARDDWSYDRKAWRGCVPIAPPTEPDIPAAPVALSILYVNGTDILAAEGNSVVCGAGTATYDAGANTLTLANAEIDSEYFGNGIYANGDLTLSLSGASSIKNDVSDLTCGITVEYGSITVTGEGSIEVRSSNTALGADARLTVASGSLNLRSINGYAIQTDGVASFGGEPYTGSSRCLSFADGVLRAYDPTNSLYVNGVDILAGGNDPVACGSGTAAYDAETGVLTLTGAVIDTGYEYWGETCGIYAEGGLTLHLSGESVIKNTGAALQYGVYTSGGLSVTGDGSLEAVSSGTAVNSDGELTMENGSLFASSESG